jgi:ParB/RepB/Spo0J family partition protein
MKRFDTQTLESDLHQLDLRFASLRLRQPRVVERLARSIEQDGQLVPVVAVAEQENRWVLIDGYLRIAALRRLARDTAWVELWDCPVSQALLWALVRVQDRTWEAIEEGAVIRELITRFALSQREVARQTGRDVSWVNRRLSLVQDLPEALFVAICQGELSTWAATRVLAPLARANNEHAQMLLTALQRDPLSTRELHIWYQHYHSILKFR